MISCENYIGRMLRAHAWDTVHSKPKQNSPTEGIATVYALQLKQFAYHTLFGEMIYAYVTCRPDICYAVTTMSKFSTMPSTLHYIFNI